MIRQEVGRSLLVAPIKVVEHTIKHGLEHAFGPAVRNETDQACVRRWFRPRPSDKSPSEREVRS